jgi:hypothetical protein
MSSKLLSKLFWLFAFLCFLYIFQSFNNYGERSITGRQVTTPVTIVSNESNERVSQLYPKFFEAYRRVSQRREQSKKLAAILFALKTAKEEGVEQPKILQKLNLMAANIYRSRWHVVYALENYNAAQGFIFDKNIAKEIKNLEQYMAKVESERGLNNDYIAYKYSGPAKTFTGRILVAYIFVDEGIRTRWSNKTKQQTQQTLALVQRWQKLNAQAYQVKDIQFINKTFVARRNPNQAGVRSIGFKSAPSDIDLFVSSVMGSLGSKNVGDFIRKQVKLAGADQGVVFIHSNFDQRSFARLCGYTHKKRVYVNGKFETEMSSNCDEEFVMLMEKVKRNRWDKMHYAQAHEMMHVFGAAE